MIYACADSHKVHSKCLLARRGDGRSPYRGDEKDISSRAFLGLTQTCKTIRAEYRPMWLRSGRLRVDFDSLYDFIDVFYPSSATDDIAPKSLTICVNSKDNYASLSNTVINLFKICQLRSRTPVQFKDYCETHYFLYPVSIICCPARREIVNFFSLNHYMKFLHYNKGWLSDLRQGRVVGLEYLMERCDVDGWRMSHYAIWLMNKSGNGSGSKVNCIHNERCNGANRLVSHWRSTRSAEEFKGRHMTFGA